MNSLGYSVIDSDTHWYETDDCFSRHIDPAYKDLAAHVVPSDEPGIGRWVHGGQVLKEFKLLPKNFSDREIVPGGILGVFTGKLSLEDISERETRMTYRPKDRPEIMERSARLKLMDQYGVRAQIMLPSSNGLAIEKELQHMPDVLCANVRAFNRWIEEEWGFGADGRIFAAPTITLHDADWAVEELESLAARGAKFFYLSTGPVGKRSPADPYFDRFWAAVQDTGMTAIFHIWPSELHELYGQYWSENTAGSVLDWSPMLCYLSTADRPISDTLAALTLHNLFGRFPKVQVVTVELGSNWIAPLFKLLDKAVGLGKGSKNMLGGKLDGLPSEILRQHLRVSPYPEDDFEALAALLGPDRILFGSDFPHPEGTKEPLDFLQYLPTSFSETTVRSIMHDNAARLLGLSLAEVG